MSLFSKQILSGSHSVHSVKNPEANRKIAIPSPLNGRVKPLDSVPLKVFSQRLLGEGIAIEPSGYQLFTPFDCKIDQLPATGEQIRLRASNGLLLLIQLGIGTERLMGEGFQFHVKEGDTVRKGDHILDFDLRKMKAQLDSILCPVTVLNSQKVKGIEPNYRQVLALEDHIFYLHL